MSNNANSQGQGGAGDPAGGARVSSADAQTVIGLLETLVPLLLHFQSQAVGQQGLGRFAGDQFAGDRGARLEQQAAVAFTEDIILDALRNLSTYLERNGKRYPGLDTYGEVIERARRALWAKDYQSAFGLVLEAYRAITVVRAIRPELPPVRARGSEENPPSGAVH
jgi:hypothetical protein